MLTLPFKKDHCNGLLFLALALFWSGSFVAIKFALQSWPPIFSAMLRVAIGTVALTGLLVIKRVSFIIEPFLLIKNFVSGVIAIAIPFIFIFMGEQYISAGLSGVINSTVPIWVFLLQFFLIKEQKTFPIIKFIGFLLGLAGIISIFWPSLIQPESNSYIGISCLLGMAISYALGAVLTQRLFKKVQVNFLINVYYQHVGSLLFLTIISAISETWPSRLQLQFLTPWLATVYLGVFSTAIAYIIYYHLIQTWGAGRATTVMYLIPVLGLMWDSLLFYNYPTIENLASSCIILLGLGLIQFSDRGLALKTKKHIPLNPSQPQ